MSFWHEIAAFFGAKDAPVRPFSPEETADLEMLMEEARRLAKPGFVLRNQPTNDAPVAYWHGIKDGAPCISIKRGDSWLCVTLDDDSGTVEVVDEALLGAPLYASGYESLPPPDALFRLGSVAVERYLEKFGWKRSDPLNSNFRGRAALEYEQRWLDNCPLYSLGIAGYGGGWHVPWPENDFEEFIDSELVVMTMEDSEPWIEVFEKQGQYRVIHRVS